MSTLDVGLYGLAVVCFVVIFYWAWLRHEINRWRAERSYPSLEGEWGLRRVPGGTDPLGRFGGSVQGFDVLVDPWSGIEITLHVRTPLWLDVADNGVRHFEGLSEATLAARELDSAFRTRLASEAAARWLNGTSPEARTFRKFVARWGNRLSTLAIRGHSFRCRPSRGAWADKPSLTAEQVRALLPAMLQVATALDRMPQTTGRKT